MDGLNEIATSAAGPVLMPLLMWIKILEVCAVALLAVALLMLVVGWIRHVSGWMRLSALVPLAIGIGVEITAYSLHTSYVYWTTYIDAAWGAKAPPAFYSHVLYQAEQANHMGTVLGWVGVVVTGIVVAVCLVGLWRLVPPHQQPRSDSLAVES